MLLNDCCICALEKSPAWPYNKAWRRARDCSIFALPPQKSNPSQARDCLTASCASIARWSNPKVLMPFLPIKKHSKNECFLIGGERGIRTLDRVAPVPPFQGGDLNRSSSSPQIYWPCRRRIIADTAKKAKQSGILNPLLAYRYLPHLCP